MTERSIEALKAELKRCNSEVIRLRDKYDEDIITTRKELKFLKEQLESQGMMLADAIEYATKLESELNLLKAKFVN